jgi:hypothetical protein
MNRFPPSVSPATFVGSAIAVGFLLINDLTINEQNALGQWFTVIASILQTNSAWLDVLVDRDIIKSDDASSKEDSQADNQSNCDDQNSTNSTSDGADLEFLKKTLKKMQEEINAVSKNNKE